jgi:N6-adenosine-specific RNA methylase IME4
MSIEETAPPGNASAGAVGVSAKVNLPEKYRAARQALAECVRVDEVKTTLDKALAMEVYAFQQKDADLIEASVYIRKRAERRIGELMEEERKAGLLAPGRPAKKLVSEKLITTLAERGIDGNLANRARKAAATPEAKYEEQTNKAIRLAVAGATNDKAFISAMKADLGEERKKRRAEIERSLAAKQCALPQKKYGVIYADPEWPFENLSDKTNSSLRDHFPTSDIDTIKRRDVPSIAADDCVLFLWATAPQLPACLDVMTAWGFEYKSQVVWVKDRAGTGYWFRGRHELLLLGTKGKPPAPAPGENWDSVVEAPKGRFAEKPDRFYELIEAYFPSLPKLEMNARKARDGWDRWGNEAPPPQTGRMKWLTMELMAAEHLDAELEPDDDPEFDTQLLTVDGLTLSVSAWARESNIHPAMLRARLKSGWHSDWILMPLPGMGFWEGNKPGLPDSPPPGA